MKINYKHIDIPNWPRRKTYEGFKDFDFPYLVVGAEVEMGRTLQFLKRHQLPVYTALVHTICRVANDIPEFKLRMRQDGVVEHEVVHADFTVAEPGDLFSIRLVEYKASFTEFLKLCRDADNKSFAPGEAAKENDHWIFMSSLPWIHFNHVVQPIDRKSGSIPRIVWGKFKEHCDRVTLPISIQAHHSLMDGVHVAHFIRKLESVLTEPEGHF